MKNKSGSIPKAVLRGLAEDISKLTKTNEGNLSILEIIEEIPYELRPEVIEGLSSFYDPAMVKIFTLIKIEYGKEFEAICNRALSKYRLAGLPYPAPCQMRNEFYRAFASKSRHTGRMTIDVAWKKPNARLYVECFYLAFTTDGVHSFFVKEDMPVDQYDIDRELQSDMTEISYLETCLLVSDAYKFNVRYMSRPALGKFLYQKYLDEKLNFDNRHLNAILQKLSPNLAPRQLANSFFHALRYQDFNYLFSILAETKLTPAMLLQQINKVMNPGALLLEGQVEEVRGSHNTAELSAYSITMYEREVYRCEFVLVLLKDAGDNWLLSGIEPIYHHKLEADSKDNPLAMQVYCRVYEIIDMDALFELLDQVENIREVEELPYGMHMRVTCYEDDHSHGVMFVSGVIADLVINGEEFVVIAQQHDTLEDFHNLFTQDRPYPLLPRGEYKIGLISAYSYLSGQYLQFEDILLDKDDELAFEDGMRFITARYAIKDRKAVLKRIEDLHDFKINLLDYNVYYQLDNCLEYPGFMAEYVLGSNWVTVSAFGERDLGAFRGTFEENMYDALEFDGLEIREEGILEILTPEVKKMYPHLEEQLKEMYLNKWYNSHLSTLRGMSPSEACQTEEGTRLLWSMFKRIKKKEQQRRLSGERKQIRLKEYLQKLNLTQKGDK